MKRQSIAGSAAVLALLTVGCGPVSTFTARGNVCPAQPEGCEVTVITSRPERDYQVMGVLDIEAFSVRSLPRNEEAFRALVSPAVCRAGGDAVIPATSGDGRYIQATVVKWVEPGAAGPVCLPEADAGAPEDDDGDDGDAEEANEDEPAAETSEESSPADEDAEESSPADEDAEPAPPPAAEDESTPSAPECSGGEPC